MRLITALLPIALAAAQQLHFEEHTIATGLTGGYQVVPIDMNKDGKIDLIALASGMKDLVWYENPGWERHVIATNLPRMINLAAWDTDGDGIPEIVIAYEFSMEATKSLGIVAVLQHNGDPRQPWTMKEIDRIPASHRLRWADIDGSGKKVVINAPLTASDAHSPDFRGHVPLVYYRPGDWKRRTISDAEEGVLHGIWITDWDGDGRDEFLTAGFLGIHLYKFGKSGDWSRSEIARGDPAAWPKSGSSDVAVGTLGKERFLAAIEPWHGNQVVVYRKHGEQWAREVVDDSLLDGHTVVTADLNGDGRDEIIAGFREKPYGVYVYSFDGKRWNRQVLDTGGVSAAACAVADLDGDGRPDVACIGSATQNLKWYRNR
ncbi:MAG TPA: VCBS repeat-containing protein [Bryobacteraceae bacterium]|nr:VCBS repeat-containing protein [Bryobacteraceae bacterium]